MFNNKSIFITGANRGIGLELVKESLNKDFFAVSIFLFLILFVTDYFFYKGKY